MVNLPDWVLAGPASGSESQWRDCSLNRTQQLCPVATPVPSICAFSGVELSRQSTTILRPLEIFVDYSHGTWCPPRGMPKTFARIVRSMAYHPPIAPDGGMTFGRNDRPLTPFTQPGEYLQLTQSADFPRNVRVNIPSIPPRTQNP